MLCRDVTRFPLAEWFDAGIRHVSTVLLICVSCRYIVIGDHAGHVKFFDQSLKLIYWFVHSCFLLCLVLFVGSSLWWTFCVPASCAKWLDNFLLLLSQWSTEAGYFNIGSSPAKIASKSNLQRSKLSGIWTDQETSKQTLNWSNERTLSNCSPSKFLMFC